MVRKRKPRVIMEHGVKGKQGGRKQGEARGKGRKGRGMASGKRDPPE